MFILIQASRSGTEPSKHAELNFSSKSEASSADAAGGLQVYYCAFCGAFALIIDTVLENLPRRSTDRSLVLEERKYAIKKSLLAGPVLLVKRYDSENTAWH